MIDKAFLVLIALIAIFGFSVLIYSAKYDNEFIAKCQANGGIPTVGKGVHLCSNPNSVIEIN